MEPTSQPVQNSIFELQIDELSKDYLLETAKWARFLSIVGFIGMAIGILVMILAVAGLSMLGSSNTLPGSYAFMSSGIMVFVMIIIFLIYFFPLYYLNRFASKTIQAVRSNDQENLIVAFKNLKSTFKFLGILTIIILAFYALAFIFGILSSALMHV